MAVTPNPLPAVAPAGSAAALGTAVAVSLGATAAVFALLTSPPYEVVPALLVPWLFVLAGALGPLWQATRFLCACLLAIGAGQLAALALAAGAIALQPSVGAAVLHTLSQVVFGATFALFVPLAAGYPGPRPPSWAWLAAVPLLLPIAGGFSAPSPSVLGDGVLPPIAELLPAWVADWGAGLFALPVIATVVGVIRWVRGDRELRQRLLWPLAALAVLAAVIALGAVTPEESHVVTDSLFLVTAPLVPVGLVAGARIRTQPDAERIRRDLADIAARVDAIGNRLEGGSPEPAGPVPGIDALTPRELEVLERVAEGRSNSAIATELHLSISAVEKHTSAVFAKLGIGPSADVHRRVAAAAAWHRATGR